MSETLIRFDSWLYYNTDEENWYLVVFINGTEIGSSVLLSRRKALAFLEKSLKSGDTDNFRPDYDGRIQRYNLYKNVDTYDDLSDLERKCALKALNNMKKEIGNAYNLLDSLK